MEFRGVEEQGELQQREEASGGESQGRVLEGLRKRYLETESQVEGWRTRWEYGGAIWVKGSRPSPAHPTLEVPLAITAVRSLELGVAAVTVTHCVQLHSQLLREATGSEPQQMRLWEAVGGWGGANQARHPWVSQVGTPGGGAPTPLSLPPPG